MSDQTSIFGNQNAPAPQDQNNGGNSNPPTPSSNDQLANLLTGIKNERGEPKYKDVQTALEALRHSQEYIPTLKQEKEANDAKTLENLSLNDQVNFSTLTLQIYQDQTVKQEMIANEKSVNAYRPNIGLQVWDSIKTGWFVLENIISFVVLLWPFALIGFAGFIGYKKFLKK